METKPAMKATRLKQKKELEPHPMAKELQGEFEEEEGEEETEAGQQLEEEGHSKRWRRQLVEEGHSK